MFHVLFVWRALCSEGVSGFGLPTLKYYNRLTVPEPEIIDFARGLFKKSFRVRPERILIKPENLVFVWGLCENIVRVGPEMLRIRPETLRFA